MERLLRGQGETEMWLVQVRHNTRVAYAEQTDTNCQVSDGDLSTAPTLS
jgi:hypothetical protein